MDDEMTPIDNDEMMDLFGDGFEEEVTEVSTKVPEVPEETEISEETPLEEDILEQTPGEIEETIVLDESTDAQIEEMEEDEGEGIVILHPDNMQELANFIGEDGIDQLTSIMVIFLASMITSFTSARWLPTMIRLATSSCSDPSWEKNPLI